MSRHPSRWKMTEPRVQAWDIMMAERDIARHRGDMPTRVFARRRLLELSKKPWLSDRNDWLGRVAAYELISKGKKGPP